MNFYACESFQLWTCVATFPSTDLSHSHCRRKRKCGTQTTFRNILAEIESNGKWETGRQSTFRLTTIPRLPFHESLCILIHPCGWRAVWLAITRKCGKGSFWTKRRTCAVPLPEMNGDKQTIKCKSTVALYFLQNSKQEPRDFHRNGFAVHKAKMGNLFAVDLGCTAEESGEVHHPDM